MTLHGLGNGLGQISRVNSAEVQEQASTSGSWPTRLELDGGFERQDSVARRTHEFFDADELFLMPAYSVSERKDTIPSPPPDFDSSPFWDER